MHNLWFQMIYYIFSTLTSTDNNHEYGNRCCESWYSKLWYPEQVKRDKRSCVVVEWVLDYQNIVSNPPHQSLFFLQSMWTTCMDRHSLVKYDRRQRNRRHMCTGHNLCVEGMLDIFSVEELNYHYEFSRTTSGTVWNFLIKKTICLRYSEALSD